MKFLLKRAKYGIPRLLIKTACAVALPLRLQWYIKLFLGVHFADNLA